MANINVRNIYLIAAVTAMSLGLGIYERLIPTRGYIYTIQTTVLSPLGTVPRGTLALNATNAVSMMTLNVNYSGGIAFFVVLALVAFALWGFMSMYGGMR